MSVAHPYLLTAVPQIVNQIAFLDHHSTEKLTLFLSFVYEVKAFNRGRAGVSGMCIECREHCSNFFGMCNKKGKVFQHLTNDSLPRNESRMTSCWGSIAISPGRLTYSVSLSNKTPNSHICVIDCR